MQKTDCFLPGQKYRYAEDWLYIAEPDQHLFTQIYYANCYPFTEGDKDLCKKVREAVVVGSSLTLTRKPFVD